jgi:hypothetical protein
MRNFITYVLSAKSIRLRRAGLTTPMREMRNAYPAQQEHLKRGKKPVWIPPGR